MTESREAIFEEKAKPFMKELNRFSDDLQYMIAATPTGPVREMLTTLNIFCLSVQHVLKAELDGRT